VRDRDREIDSVCMILYSTPKVSKKEPRTWASILLLLLPIHNQQTNKQTNKQANKQANKQQQFTVDYVVQQRTSKKLDFVTCTMMDWIGMEMNGLEMNEMEWNGLERIGWSNELFVAYT
jgi:hypothetical protein